MGQGIEGRSTRRGGILQQTLKKVNSVGLDLAAENLHMSMKPEIGGRTLLNGWGLIWGNLCSM